MTTTKPLNPLASLKFALHIADRHLSKLELATARHDLRFIKTVHLDSCDKCAKANKAKGGAWRYDPANRNY